MKWESACPDSASKIARSLLRRKFEPVPAVLLLTIALVAAGLFGSTLAGGGLLAPGAVNAQEDHGDGGFVDDHGDDGFVGDHGDGGGVLRDSAFNARYVVEDCFTCGRFIDPGCPLCGGYVDGDPTFVSGPKVFDSAVGLWYVIPASGTDYDPSAIVLDDNGGHGGHAHTGSLRERYQPPDFPAESFKNLGELKDALGKAGPPSSLGETGSLGETDPSGATGSPGETGSLSGADTSETTPFSTGADAPGETEPTGDSGPREDARFTTTPRVETPTVKTTPGPSEAGKFAVEQYARRKARNEFERQREWFNAGRREVNLCPLCGPSAEQKVFNKLRSIVNDFDRFQKTGKNPPLDVSYFTAKQAKKKLERAIKRDRKERFERIRFSCVIYCI